MGRERKKKRIKQKLLVSIRWDKDLSEEIMGITANISESGICVFTERSLPQDALMTILISSEGNTFYLKGEAIWSNTYSDRVISTGISLDSSPLEYIDFVNMKNYH